MRTPRIALSECFRSPEKEEALNQSRAQSQYQGTFTNYEPPPAYPSPLWEKFEILSLNSKKHEARGSLNMNGF